MTEWIYIRRGSDGNGHLIDPTNRDVGTGYSGHDKGLNNPDMQDIPDFGPIPEGRWMVGVFGEHPHLGPVAASLAPTTGTETFGRSGFFVHGDGQACNQSSSHGCIVLARNLREMIRDSGTNLVLTVE